MAQEGAWDIVAFRVDAQSIHIECPFCWDNYEEDEVTPRPGAHRAIHTHSSGGDLSNRTVHRAAHCWLSRMHPQLMNGFNVTISHETEKVHQREEDFERDYHEGPHDDDFE